MLRIRQMGRILFAVTAIGLATMLSGCSDAADEAAATPTPIAAAVPVAYDTPAEPSPGTEIPRGTGFDFYVLALSWSPTYCQTAGSEANEQQCAEGRKLGFIVHGLWPQFEHGYPEYCPSREPERVPSAAGLMMLDVVPSMGLVGHLWRKHGSCSGLTQKDFFKVVRAARDRVVIPARFLEVETPEKIAAAEVEDAFIAANEGLTRSGIAAACNGGRLREVRICLTHDLAFRPCREVDSAGCRAGSLAIPPPG